jgi:hypothetical protein
VTTKPLGPLAWQFAARVLRTFVDEDSLRVSNSASYCAILTSSVMAIPRTFLKFSEVSLPKYTNRVARVEQSLAFHWSNTSRSSTASSALPDIGLTTALPNHDCSWSRRIIG